MADMIKREEVILIKEDGSFIGEYFKIERPCVLFNTVDKSEVLRSREIAFFYTNKKDVFYLIGDGKSTLLDLYSRRVR